MNEAAYVLLCMCLGGFIATFYLSYQFSKGFERMRGIANIILYVASYLENTGEIMASIRIADLANEILKECE